MYENHKTQPVRHMTQSPTFRRLTIWSLLAFSIHASVACSIIEPEDGSIRIRNRTEASIFVDVWDLESSYLLDLLVAGQISPDPDQVLAPGDSRVVRVSDVSGDFQLGNDLRLFVYEVVGDKGEYRSIVTQTADQLRESDYRIVIDSF